jgi:hypothetical protein
MTSRLFAPKSYAIREPLMTGRRNGATINPPRLAEIGGMTTRNADQKEPELRLKKPGGTR